MDFRLNEEQDMMRRMVRDFAQKEIAPFIPVMEETEQFPREIVKKMGEIGLMGIPIPEEWGGAGADFQSYILAIHEISKVSATVGVILSVHTSFVPTRSCTLAPTNKNANTCRNWQRAKCSGLLP